MEERDPHLNQAYREARHPEPSPGLDARILEAARQALARPKPTGRSRWFTWALPLSSAVVLVLGISLLFEAQQQAPEYMEPPKAIPPTGQGGIDDAAPAPLPAEPTVRLPYLAQQESVPQADASESVEPMGTDVQSGPALPQERAAVEQLENSGSVAAPAPAPEPFPAQAGAAAALSPAPQPAARAEAHPMPQAVPMAAQESSDATTKMKRPPAARMVPPPTASAVAPGQETAPAFSFSQGLGKRKAAAPATERPEQMVETIRRLLREGRQEEARKALEKLRRTYPGFALPEDLKDL